MRARDLASSLRERRTVYSPSAHNLIGALAVTLAGALGACGDDGLKGRGDGATTDDDTATTDTATATPDTAAPDDTSVAPDSTADTAPADTTPEDTAGPKDTGTVDDTTPTDTGPADTADTSAPPAEVKFVVMGDTGEGNESQKRVAAAIVSTCARLGCDLVILLGDNIYDAGVESVLDTQWETKFEIPYKDVDLPFYAVLGNHDNGGFLSQVFGDLFGGAGAEFARGDHEVAYTAVSDKWKMPGRTYDFVKGPAHFFALDTNDMVWSDIDNGAEARTQIMRDTFPGLIDDSTATWKIAFGHHPYRSNGQHGNAGTYEGLEEGIGDLIAAVPLIGDLGPTIQGKWVKEGLEDIVCGRVDLYFAGHEHNRQWFPEDTDGACAGTTFVVSGAGAKLTEFKRSQPTLFQDDQKPGFFWVHLQGNDIAVEAVDEDGVTQWTHQDSKGAQ